MKLIVATDLNGVIGVNNTIPWYIPEDLKHFKNMTMGETVIMGRKTSDSLPSKFCGKLPGRRNIILSSATLNDNRLLKDGVSDVWTSDVDGLLNNKYNLDLDRTWVIGGQQIYNLFLPVVKTIHLTEVCIKIERSDADAYFQFNKDNWTLMNKEEVSYTTSEVLRSGSSEPYIYRHLIYNRK